MPPAVDLLPRTLLVGRTNELRLLHARYETAAAGRLHVVLLTGEPGIGKTRLLDTFGQAAQAAGAGVLRGGASDAEGMPPYLPFLEALGDHIRVTPDELLRAQLDDRAATLATILPEIPLRLGTLAPGYPLPSEQARMRLYEALGTFLGAISSERPTVLLLDDLHWADPASLDLLTHIARRQPDTALLLVGAYRPGDAAANPAFGRMLEALNRLRVLTQLTITPLSHAEIGVLASGLLGGPPGAELTQRLHAQSEGNPFFAEELLRGWQETSRPASDGSLLPIDAAAPLPDGISGAVRRRVEHLPPPTIEHLRNAAVIGRTFDISILADISGMPADVTEEQLQPAVRAVLLRSTPDGTYAFSHDTIRACLYQDITTTRLRRLHGFIGRALEAHPAGSDALHLAELAYHFARSGDRERGITYAQRAAADALRAYAPAEAQQHLHTALLLLDDNDPRRAALLTELADAALLAGAEHEAVSAYTTAIQCYQSSGDTLAAARAARRLGHACWRQEQIAQARAAFESALHLLGTTPSADLVYVLTDLATLLAISVYAVDSALALSSRALELSRLLEDQPLRAVAQRTHGALLVRANAPADGITLLEEALELASSAGDITEAAECCAHLATSYMWQGDLNRSRDVTLRRLMLAQRSHDPYQLRHVYTWLAVCAGLQGRMPESQVHLEQAWGVVERLESVEPLAYLHFCRSAFACFMGEYPRAEAEFQSMLSLFQSIGSDAIIWYYGLLGLIQARRGNLPAAQTTLDALETLLATIPTGTMPMSNPLTMLCAAALDLDDLPRLERYYPLLGAFEGQFHDMLVDRILGQIEIRRAAWPAAEAHLLAAEAAARRHDLRWELLWTLEARAALALAQGGPAAAGTARDCLQSALSEARGIGAPHDVARLQARIEALGSGRFTPYPGGLSRREAEVLRHLAAGHSNRDIAAALSVSEKTIENHLTHIYTKLQVENRAAAAAFAVRHGLA